MIRDAADRWSSTDSGDLYEVARNLEQFGATALVQEAVVVPAAPEAAEVVRFFLPNVLGPSLVGVVIGGGVALAVGFGITRLVWELRQLQTVMNYIPTRLAVSLETAAVLAVLIALIIAIVLAFGRFVFARTARQGLTEG